MALLQYRAGLGAHMDDDFDINDPETLFGLEQMERADFDEIARHPWLPGNDRPRPARPQRRDDSYADPELADELDIAAAAFDPPRSPYER